MPRPQGLPPGSVVRPRRGNVLSVHCPSRQVLSHITSRWGGLVLLALEGGTLRYGELRIAVGGVSHRMLAATLRVLERDGLVKRVAHDVIPPHVDYSLTPLGQEAAVKLRGLADWIETSLPRIAKAWERYQHTRSTTAAERSAGSPGRRQF